MGKALGPRIGGAVGLAATGGNAFGGFIGAALGDIAGPKVGAVAGGANRWHVRLPIRAGSQAIAKAPFCAVEVRRQGVGSYDSPQAVDSQYSWAQSAYAIALRRRTARTTS